MKNKKKIKLKAKINKYRDKTKKMMKNNII